MRSLAFILFLSLLLPCFKVIAEAVTQDEIDELVAQREEIEKEREAQQSIVDDLETKHASILERKKALDDRNALTLQQIELNSQQISLYTEMIAQKAAEVEIAKDTEAKQLEKYRSRVRAMEENGGYDYLALILNATSLGALLTAIDDMGEIMSADKKLEDEYITARQNCEAIVAEYEDYKSDLEDKQAELEKQQASLRKQLEDTDTMIQKIKDDLESESTELEELDAAVDETQKQIDVLVAELEEQKRKEKAANAGASSGYTGAAVSGSGNFIWPVSCSYITSSVGYRWHPVSGVWKYHSGMDIGCQYGDAIWASDGGTVCLASWYGGYGNCVMIDHNNGYYTLYGHMSSIAVSLNQSVSQGQTVGYVGSTGVSTGPHLHFEIRGTDSDGDVSCLDFASWFSGLTYSPDSGG